MVYSRKLARSKEKEELEFLRKTYGKKPKEFCPQCNKKSLFMQNDKGEIYCIRCNKIVKVLDKK